MNQYVFLAIIAVLQLFRGIYLWLGKKSTNFIWISLFLVCVPFTFEKVIELNNSENINSGTLGSSYKITFALMLALVLIPKIKLNSFFNFKLKNWISVVSIFIIISILNPLNVDARASIAFAIFFFSHILLFKIILSFINGTDLLKGIFDGFFILCLIQLPLAICFPLLGMTQVTEMFHVGGLEGATRLGSRVGAIGTFVHPGSLAIYTIFSSSFFVSCFLYNYDKKKALFILFINTFTIVLTYSRTSYLTFVIIIIFLAYAKRNAKKNIFSIPNMLKIIVPTGLVIMWLVFLSPFSDVFLKTDADAQYLNRTMHYIMAYEVFRDSPVVGVGLNSHLAYLNAHPLIISSVKSSDAQSLFFRENPIHNIHLIVLAETGLLGMLAWIYFLVRNIYQSANEMKERRNQIISLTFIGVLVSIGFYGTTGWSPFSSELLPYVLFFTFFSISVRDELKLVAIS